MGTDVIRGGYLRGASACGTAASNFLVYSCCGRANTSSASPCSTIAAPVHHRHLMGQVLDHRQVVADEQVRQSELVLQIQQQVDDAGLDGHIERRHRFVECEDLAVSAPALVRYRCAASDRRRTRWDSGSASARRSPTVSSSSATRDWMSLLPEPLACNGSASMSNTGNRGSREATGSWKTTCRSRRSARRRALSRVATSLPSTSMVPACGGGEFEDLVQRRRLARPGLPDDPQRLAPVQFEADAVDGANFADVPTEHHTLGQPVGLHQITYPHHDFVGRRGRLGAVRCGRNPVDVGRAAPDDLLGADARGGVVGGDGHQRRFVGPARVDDQRAARRERAAGIECRPVPAARPGSGPAGLPCGASRRGTEPNSPAV